MTATERAAWIALRLAEGRGVTCAMVARDTCCTSRSAQRTLANMSRVIPIYRESGGVWRLLRENDKK